MGFQAESLLCWAKMAVSSMPQWFSIENLCWWWRGEGHQVIEAPPDFGEMLVRI